MLLLELVVLLDDLLRVNAIFHDLIVPRHDLELVLLLSGDGAEAFDLFSHPRQALLLELPLGLA